MAKIAVLMPVYNAEKFLDESISSILEQSFKDFKFLILDDASTDNSLKIIQKYDKLDKRIEVFCNKTNQKEAISRNILLHQANTEFIAWMDADDISRPQRLQIQYDFLQNNPEIDILGSANQNWSPPLTDHQIKSYLLLFGCPLINPSTMIRLKKIKKYNLCYNAKFIFAPDYKFWVDCAPFVKFSNLKEVLIYYRTHPNQISQKHLQKQRDFHLKIIKEQYQKFSIHLTDNLYSLLLGWRAQKTNYSELLQINQSYITPLLIIKKFYEYQKIDKRILLKYYLCKHCLPLKLVGVWFFVKNYSIFFLKLNINKFYKKITY